MAFDLNNFVIDRVVRGIAVSQGDNAKLGIAAGDVLFSINQITNPSLNCTSESTDAVDALSRLRRLLLQSGLHPHWLSHEKLRRRGPAHRPRLGADSLP